MVDKSGKERKIPLKPNPEANAPRHKVVVCRSGNLELVTSVERAADIRRTRRTGAGVGAVPNSSGWETTM
ncbi:hypothetical protein KJ641_04060 [Patescibacteria group bacterium]|nr:hypothetical protein [Patescibacteria group bacterium]MBU1896014.1 hypothetical protein [Patescibacteria group bacterium]